MLHIWRTNNISDKDNTNGQSIMYGQLSSPGGVRCQKTEGEDDDSLRGGGCGLGGWAGVKDSG